MKTTTSTPRNSERGNAFLIILLGVVLFGALAFMMSRSMRSANTESMSTRDAELAAADILSYTQSLLQAVDRVRRKGCSENQLSFDSPALPGASVVYNNPNAPGDYTCHIFRPEGGNMTWMNPPPGTNDGVGKKISFSNFTATYFFDARHLLVGVGTEGASGAGLDLKVEVEVNQTICAALNKKLHGDPFIPSTNWNYWGAFNGTFLTTGYIGDGCTTGGGESNDGSTVCRGKEAYCRFNSDAPGYYFYQVLIAR